MALFGKKELVGLDIGSSSVKIMKLRESGGTYQVAKFGVEPLPQNVVVDGAIMDHSAVVEAIKAGFARLGIKERMVATSIEGHSIIVKKVILPTTTPEDLEESIQWEVEQYIPFEVKEVKIDFQVLGPLPDDPTRMDVLLVAAKNELVEDYVSVVKEAGLTPTIIDLDSIALGNAFEACAGISEAQIPMVVNVGANFMNIIILEEGVPLFTRDVLMGGSMYNHELQRNFGVSYDIAERMKKGEELEDFDPERVDAILKNVSGIIATEVQRSHNFYAASFPDKHVTKIFLTGGASRSPFLREMMEDKLGIGVELFDPFDGLVYDESEVDGEMVKAYGPAASVVTGLAMRKPGDK
ncbi:MAG: type IV pilus assembly protein PilM [Deltaproteobacteria bacterium]|nr:MAG: type IV pilus assembly protein PilM [Deltaproteobacteria bacterium]